MIERGEQLRLAFWCWNLLDFIEWSLGDVGQRARNEVLERRVAFIKTPPHPAGEVLHFLRSDFLKPLPCQRALAHATDGDNAHDPNRPGSSLATIKFQFLAGDPISEHL